MTSLARPVLLYLMKIKMHATQKAILEISKKQDMSFVGIRQLARKLNVHPQTAKHHLNQLIKKGLIKKGGVLDASSAHSGILHGANLIKIPYMGAANCGPASLIAKDDIEGYINISSRLLDTKEYGSLFAIKADGTSLNQAQLNNQSVENGDYVIIDSKRMPQRNDYVLATINNLANLKKYHPEHDSSGRIYRIALLSESADDYDPIFIHPEDEAGRLIAGVAIQVIKKPQPLSNNN